ncbi:hypothetical protein THER5_1890 [Bifidobacterium thermacidophilum subsp. thermacidophilum]|uniref:Uncharacterized protein n=1 Tax=Bifidobacterium thermacidophilum subsp. thermacidophilum TaxID=79262 RepID=A0A087E4C3_9BIFI|nr:hypothetical protein THER5_1890 [Bifidobacterium thermacidophilum subsp. thermacidophilum]
MTFPSEVPRTGPVAPDCAGERPRKCTLNALIRWRQPPGTCQERPVPVHSKTARLQRFAGWNRWNRAVLAGCGRLLGHVELEFDAPFQNPVFATVPALYARQGHTSGTLFVLLHR